MHQQLAEEQPSGGQENSPHQPRTPAALDTVLLTCSPLPGGGSALGTDDHRDRQHHKGVTKGDARVYLPYLYFGCTHVFNPGAQG